MHLVSYIIKHIVNIKTQIILLLESQDPLP